MSNLAGSVRATFKHRDRSQRVVAYGFTAVLTAILTIGLGLQIYMTLSAVPEMYASDRRNNRAFNSAYAWIEANLPSGANLLWEQDVVYYLKTGRHAVSFPIPSRQWYAYDFDRDMDYYRKIDEFARAQHLSYILLNKEAVLRAADANPNLEKVHAEPGTVLYRVTEPRPAMLYERSVLSR
jgi:hypothetical protein